VAALDAPLGRARRDLLALAAISLLWWLPVLWIGVRGEFPLYDDWAYARSVQTWLATGSFARPAFILAPTLSNALIGLAFTKLFGFSFAVLRVSNLLMGWLALGVVYGFARQLRARVEVAALAAACLAVCPLFFHLSYTFMTDVAFACFTTAGLMAAGSLLAGRSSWALPALALLSVAAVLSRTPGLVLPAAAGAAFVIDRRRKPAVLLGAVAGTLACFVLYWFSPMLFGAQDSGARISVTTYLGAAFSRPEVLFTLVRNAASSFYLLGLFCAPLWLAGGFRDLGRAGWATLAAAALLGTVGIWSLGIPPPFSIDQIRDLGLGALDLHGSDTLPHAPAGFWIVVPMLGFAAGAGTLWRIGRFLWPGCSDIALQRRALPLLLFVGGYLALLVIKWPFIDRWLVPVAPALLLLLAASTPSLASLPLRVAGGVALALLLAFSVLGTRDQLDLHRAWADLLAEVESRGIPPDQIDGGSAYNAWHHFRSIGDAHLRSPRTGHRWVRGDEVVISLTKAMPGYAPMASKTVRIHLTPAEVTLRAFRRVTSPSRSTIP